jgi:hypothetical protein
MIRGNTAAHQPVGGGQPLKHIDLDGVLDLLLKMFGGVKSRGSRTNNRNAQRIAACAHWCRHKLRTFLISMIGQERIPGYNGIHWTDK